MIRLFLVASTLLVCAFAEAQVKVGANFDKVYIPRGFDSNDNVQVVGEGAFRSSCFRPANVMHKVDHAKKEIYISPTAYQYFGFCLMVILPYDRVLEFGVLQPGTYKIYQNDEVLGEIPIRQTTVSTADDHLYAPITQAFIVKSQGEYQWGITGELTNSCMYLDEVRITVETDVIVVQPIVKMEQRSSCRDGLFQFSKFGKLGDVPKGRYLLHVRSMNGKAVNSLVNIY